MKHLKITILLLLAVYGAQTMSAHDFEVDGIYYKKNGTNAIVTYKGYNYYDYSEYTGSVNIPSTITFGGTTYSVTKIGKNAFNDCSSLTSVTIPNSVTSIGESAFSSCRGLTSVTIPNSVTKISTYTFRFCSGLTSVTIPNSVTLIGHGAFSYCSGLTSVTIPDSVTSISYEAFKGCSGLTKVSIPNSVIWIGDFAFQNCSSLTKVTWNARLCADFSSASSTPFYDISANIKNFIFGEGVEKIPAYLCYGMSKLTNMTIPNSVTSIGREAFSGCSGLNNIYSLIDNPNNVTLGSSVFYNVNKSNCTLTVPVASYDLYKNANQWKDFLNIVRDVLVTSISLSKTQLSLYYGQTYTLQATVSPSNAYSVINWSSSNTTVATVDQSGMITAKKLGRATITATATDGSGKSASCVVTVTGVESITLNKTETSMYIGDTETLTATIFPSDVINNNLSWTSSSNTVATVDQNGVVTAKAIGTATITATATDGSGVSGSCVVKVVPENTMAVDTLVHIRGSERVARTLDISLNNRGEISGVQFDLTLPTYVEFANVDGYPDIWLDDTRKARNHSVDINLIGTKKYRVIVSSPTNKTFKGNDGAILHFNVLVDLYPSIGSATIKLSDIVLAEADETQHTIGSVTSDVRFVYVVGDANADTEVDVADYVLTANKIMQRPVTSFWSDAANANYNDNTLNVTDLVAITNIALEIREKEIRPAIDGFQFAPAVAFPGIDFPLTARVTEASADRTVVAIEVDNAESIAALQLDLDLPDGVTLESAAVTERSHAMIAACGNSPEGLARVILSSFGRSDIDAGSGEVLTLTLRGKVHHGDIMGLTGVLMAERNLVEHGASGDLTLDLNGITGVSTVVYDHVNIYGANGSIVIESPVDGMAQIVRLNGISQEVEVKAGRNVYPVSVTRGDIIIATFNGTTKKIQY